MYILSIFLLFLTPGNDPEVITITRPKVETYTTRNLCELDTAKQIKDLLAEVEVEPALISTKCIEITGPAGTSL